MPLSACLHLARKLVARATGVGLGLGVFFILFWGFVLVLGKAGMDSLPCAKRRRQSNDGDIEASPPAPATAPVVIFAHGAGAPSSSDWMQRFIPFLPKLLQNSNLQKKKKKFNVL